MRTKKIMATLIAAAFILSLILSFALLFSVKKVEAEFFVSAGKNVSHVTAELNKFEGANLLFFDVDKINQSLKEHPYYEVLEVEKKYPNVIRVQIRERREVYYVKDNGRIIVLAEDGFVLNTVNQGDFAGNERDKILLEISGVQILNANVGSYVKSDDDAFLYSIFDMCKSVHLTDCINFVKVDKAPEKYDAIFQTYTGVKMLIPKANERGVDKITTAFNAYEQNTNDYEKTFNQIIVTLMDNGEIVADWSER